MGKIFKHKMDTIADKRLYKLMDKDRNLWLFGNISFYLGTNTIR